MTRPVLVSKERKLNYQFMAAEADWILSGDDRVETIAPYNKHIAQFSDNGVTFFGAYGPKVQSQLDYVVDTIRKDPHTRQAFLTIWRENPGETKDVPCTITLGFMLRNRQVNCHAFMRSSDIWLGLPYDVFNFSMITSLVCCMLNDRELSEQALPLTTPHIQPGTLYLTAANQHLYARNREGALNVCNEMEKQRFSPHPDVDKGAPTGLHISGQDLYNTLQALKRSKPGDVVRWWEK